MSVPKIYIFGDSFCWEKSYFPDAWPAQLSKKYSVQNFSMGGFSNYEIFLKICEQENRFEPGNTVLVCWSDPNRFYSNPGIKKDYKLYENYLTNFHNDFLNRFFQKQIMQEVKKILIEKKVQFLFLWSFPSDYKTEVLNANWVNALLEDYDPNNYIYMDEFENEVKPALFYFSKKEAEKFKTHKEISEFFINDARPNHIGDQKVHDAIFDLIDKFVQHKISGKINLLELMNER